MLLNTHSLVGSVTYNQWRKKVYPKWTEWKTTAGSGSSFWVYFFPHWSVLRPCRHCRGPFHLYVTWRSSCLTHGIWLKIQRKTQHPDDSWPVLTTSGGSDLVWLLPESHQHWIISTFGIQCQGFPPTHTHTHTLWMEPIWDHLNRPDVTGCIPLRLRLMAPDFIICIHANACMMSQDLTMAQVLI